jgi:hypothetical protein
MRVTPNKLSSGSLLALLTALLFLAPSGKTDAQSASRSFQMALYVELKAPNLTSADADISMFGEGQAQPPGRSVIKYKSWPTGPTLSINDYDWSRIVAAEIDEPYTYFMSEAERGIHTNPCGSQDSRLAEITHAAQLLPAAADALKSIAPWTRLWVNFTPDEVRWMMQAQCSQTAFNKAYIDVISVDDYNVPFAPEVQNYYGWFAANQATPQQQLALIPGTFSGQESFLQGYFDYANANQRCNLSLGSRGATGSFDGCLIWIVMGFPAQTFTQNGTTYVGVLDPQAGQIATDWRKEIALPVRPGLSYELSRQQIVSVILQQWLGD